MFFYKIRYFHEDEPTSGPYTESGVVCAGSYGKAADIVVEFYGEKNIISFDALYKVEEILTEEEIKEMLEE